MKIFLSKKYTRSTKGFLIRGHRIIAQVLLCALLIHTLGWYAATFALAICAVAFALEIIPYGSFDKWINPWIRRELDEANSNED